MKKRKDKKFNKKVKKHLEKMYKFEKFECWDLGTHFIKFLYPRFHFFVTKMKRHGIPCSYYSEDVFCNENLFDVAKSKWETDLRKMLFAIEFFDKISSNNFLVLREGTEEQNLWNQYLLKTGPVYEGIKLFFENITEFWD